MSEQEKIDRRLLNQMSKAEQEAFDKELMQDSDLADSFDFNQDMADFFSNENPDLEDKLDALGTKHFGEKTTSPKENNKKNWLWLLIPFLFVGSALLYFGVDSSVHTVVLPESVQKEGIATPTAIDQEKESDQIPLEEENIQPNEEIIPDFNAPSEKEKSAPIAALDPADFETNPALEVLLLENVRDVSVTTLSNPANEAVLDVSKELFELNGTTNIKPPYQLTIYSNRTFDFDNDYPFLRQEIAGIQSNEEFEFDSAVKISFSPGLYYLLLQNNEGKLMSISKFEVR